MQHLQLASRVKDHTDFLCLQLRQSSSISYCLRPIRRKDKDPFYSFDVPHRESLQLERLVIKWEPSALAVKDAACAAEGSDRGVAGVGRALQAGGATAPPARDLSCPLSSLSLGSMLS